MWFAVNWNTKCKRSGRTKLYKEPELLGGGSFGKVFIGEFESRKVAVKRVQKIDFGNARNPLMPFEAELLLKVDNENVLDYICTKQDENYV